MCWFHITAECTPEEAFSILGEKIIFASGSPFSDVDLGILFTRVQYSCAFFFFTLLSS